MKEDHDVVSITFWEKGKCIMHHFSSMYPSYRIGDTIWLEIRIIPGTKYGNKKELPLKCYKICDIQHGLEQDYNTGISTLAKIEVYLKPKKG